MNSNTVIAYRGGTGRNDIPVQTLATATETEFQLSTDTTSTTVIAVLTLPRQTNIFGSAKPIDPNRNRSQSGPLLGQFGAPGESPWYTDETFDSAHPFLISLSGTIVPANNAANTLTLNIYNGTSKSGTAIATTGALTGTESTVTPFQFILQGQYIWDSASGLINGQQWWTVSGTSLVGYNTWKVTPAAASVVLPLQFCASAKWGNAAGGVITVSEFRIDRQ